MFSLAVDDSTDVSDTAHVLIFIRVFDKSYKDVKTFLMLRIFTTQLLGKIALRELKMQLIKRTFDGKTWNVLQLMDENAEFHQNSPPPLSVYL